MTMYIAKVKVDVTPTDGQPPVIRISQHDSGSRILITLTDGADLYAIPDGASVTMRGKTPDGEEISEDLEHSGSDVILVTNENMSGESGRCICKLRIHAGEARLSTQLFLIEVEPDPSTVG